MALHDNGTRTTFYLVRHFRTGIGEQLYL